MTLRTLNYGNYGIFLIMGNAGFCPSAVGPLGCKADFTHAAEQTWYCCYIASGESNATHRYIRMSSKRVSFASQQQGPRKQKDLDASDGDHAAISTTSCHYQDMNDVASPVPNTNIRQILLLFGMSGRGCIHSQCMVPSSNRKFRATTHTEEMPNPETL